MERIRPKTNPVDETCRALVDAICSGALQPGDRLNQDELAARLNVSRQPVNRAIQTLTKNGLVSPMRLNWHHIRHALAEALRETGNAELIWREHGAILDAMLAGEDDTAAASMEDHLGSAYGRNVAALAASAFEPKRLS